MDKLYLIEYEERHGDRETGRKTRVKARSNDPFGSVRLRAIRDLRLLSGPGHRSGGLMYQNWIQK